MDDKRTVVLKSGYEKPFSELRLDDVFNIREGPTEVLEEMWECVSEVYPNDDGILTVVVNPYNTRE